MFTERHRGLEILKLSGIELEPIHQFLVQNNYNFLKLNWSSSDVYVDISKTVNFRQKVDAKLRKLHTNNKAELLMKVDSKNYFSIASWYVFLCKMLFWFMGFFFVSNFIHLSMRFYETSACYTSFRIIRFYFSFIRANPSILSQNTFRIGSITSDEKMFHLRGSTLRPTFLNHILFRSNE